MSAPVDVLDVLAKANAALDLLAYSGDPILSSVAAELKQARAVVAELITALKSAREWHLCDKWRRGSSEQREAWQRQLDLYDAALAKVQP